MPVTRVTISEGKEWLIGVGELVVPIKTVRDMSAEDIGRIVRSLIYATDEMQPYFQGGRDFATLEDFWTFKAAEKTKVRERSARKARNRGVRAGLAKDYYRVFVQLGRRDGFRCVVCGSDEDLQVDHRHPVAKGGDNRLENLQLLCGRHNREKSDRAGE